MWIEIAKLQEFEPSQGVAGTPAAGTPAAGIPAECRGHPLALFKLQDGVYALDDICSHEHSRLSEGDIWDDEVYCPKHGSRFNIRTGAVKGLPAIKPVRSYPVKIEGDSIFVEWEE
jgi:nitrite reductase/ring-hydroxylating ferredoxin subunit